MSVNFKTFDFDIPWPNSQQLSPRAMNCKSGFETEIFENEYLKKL